MEDDSHAYFITLREIRLDLLFNLIKSSQQQRTLILATQYMFKHNPMDPKWLAVGIQTPAQQLGSRDPYHFTTRWKVSYRRAIKYNDVSCNTLHRATKLQFWLHFTSLYLNYITSNFKILFTLRFCFTFCLFGMFK